MLNGNLNTALLLLGNVIDGLENGFVACQRCGDQEDTKTLDCMTDLHDIKKALLAEVESQLSRSAHESDAVLMPSELGTEGKALLSGEFQFSVDHSCSACGYHGPQEDCEVCGGEIDYTELVTIPWPAIKAIYKKAVAHFGSNPPS